MEKVLQKIQVISWGSILIGCFLAIKIPETILSNLIFANFYSASSELTLGLTKIYFGIILSLALVSAGLIIGGIYLLKKKNWARNFLEMIYWVLLMVSLVQIGKTIGVLGMKMFQGVLSSEMLFLELTITIPLVILLIITIIALNSIKNPLIKKILHK